MGTHLLADYVDAIITGSGGIVVTLLAFRIIGGRSASSRVGQWHNRWGKWMRILGPCLILFAVLQAVRVNAAPRFSGDWRTYRNDEGPFVIEFPDRPTETRTSMPLGEQIVNSVGYDLTSKDGDVNYRATVSNVVDAQGSEDTLLERIVQEVPSMTQSTLVNKHSLIMDGHPAIELTLTAPGKPFSMTIRVCVANHRVYRVLAVVPHSEVGAPDHLRVLDSFHPLPPLK